MREFTKKKYIAEGMAQIRGQQVPYQTTAENFRIDRQDGRYDGCTFTFGYERKDVDTDGRPVLFAWNGGPGSSSIFVHLGLLAPERVKCGDGVHMPKTAPFEMTANHECLLDICDFVIVDAIGTGYGELADEDAGKYQASTERDVQAAVMTIRRWLTAHERWNSPLYIMGESYGTIRNALVADGIFCSDETALLQHLSGVIMLGTALTYSQKEFPVPLSVLNLTAMAAAHWYHHHEENPDFGTLEAFVDECRAFADHAYLLALHAGSDLAEEKRVQIAENLQRYTGLPVEKILEDRLEVDIFRYPVLGLAGEGKSMGIYDARFVLGKKAAEKYDFFSDDACNATGMPAFLACFERYAKKALRIDTEEEYRLLVMDFDRTWDFKTKKYPPEALENAMHRNPGLKLMFGIGYYDMLTTAGYCEYLLRHYQYPKERTFVRYYQGGHMPYLSDQEAERLQRDIREFILK